MSSHFAAAKPHFWKGQLPVAFVFSVPGSHEKSANRPVAGATGENLDFALAYLHMNLPATFPSNNRYAYRITNAYCRPIAKSLGDSSSQATNSQVLETGNVVRVQRDLIGCDIVILCGRKAQLLESAIRQSGRTVICAWHTSNQALSSKFHSPELLGLSDPNTRRRLRAQLWAKELLDAIDARQIS